MMKRVKCLAAVGIVISLFLGESALAKEWKPYQFSGKNEHFEYLITSFENEEEETSTYILDIKEGKGGLYDVTVTSKWTTEELGDSILGGFWGAQGMGMQFLFFNPMFMMFFGNHELKVGREIAGFMGTGIMTITGKEKIAGREGFVCEFREKEKEPVIARWVIDPDLALPLKTENFEKIEDKGKETRSTGKMELQKYSR